MSRYKLSVIIIAYNEEENIANTIRSVMKATSQASEFLKSYEIIMVDGNSSDKTVEIASRYPITILQDKKPLGPSAARYIGYKHVAPDAKFILFIDGDIIIYENWLSLAIQYMLRKPNVAGVSGYIKSVIKDYTINPADSLSGSPQQRLSGKLALYKKNIMNQVGSFDPRILGEEERELGFRIRQQNYELHLLNVLVGSHHHVKRKNSVFHRTRFCVGAGQLIARELYRGTPLALELLKRYYRHFFVFGWVVICMPVALLSLLGLLHPLLWKAIAILSVLGYLIIAMKEGELFKVAFIFIATFLESFSMLVGFIKKYDNTILPSAKLLKKGIQINIEREEI